MKIFNAATIALALCAAAFNITVIAAIGAPAPSAKADVKTLNVDLDVTGVAKTVHKNVVKKVANKHDEPPFMNGEPEHVRILFDNDKVSDYTDYLQRQLLVYPVAEYAALFKGAEKADFDKGFSQLKTVINTGSVAGVKKIFILPAAEATEVFHNQVKFLKFKNGSGVSFLTSYAQDDAPVKNGDLFYTFQGLSADGKYFVGFYCPVQTKKLGAGMQPKAAAAMLSKLPRDQFTPNLDTIDKMLQTISLK